MSRKLFILFCFLLAGSTMLSFSIIARFFHFDRREPTLLKHSKSKRQKPRASRTLFNNSTSTSATSNNGTDSRFSMQAIHTKAKKLSRSFPVRLDRSSWCFPEKQYRHNFKRGLFFVKTKKASSSTAAGAVLRIMHQHPECQAIEWEHRYAREYGIRMKNHSFLLGIVRDPAKRSLSQVFYSMISIQNNTASDFNILSWLISHREVSFNFQLRYLSVIRPVFLDLMSSGTNKTAKPLLEQFVRRTLKYYDFVLLAERMDESLVALSMILGLPVTDVVTTRSKVSGTSYQLIHNEKSNINNSNEDSDNGRCVLIQKPFMSPNISHFLQSDDWRATNYADYLLHQAVNLSLDLTIDSMGREIFDEHLREYRRLQSAIFQNCFESSNTEVVFPCSQNGAEQSERSKASCYSRDFGCGYPCMDRTLEQLSLSLYTE